MRNTSVPHTILVIPLFNDNTHFIEEIKTPLDNAHSQLFILGRLSLTYAYKVVWFVQYPMHSSESEERIGKILNFSCYTTFVAWLMICIHHLCEKNFTRSGRAGKWSSSMPAPTIALWSAGYCYWRRGNRKYGLHATIDQMWHRLAVEVQIH